MRGKGILSLTIVIGLIMAGFVAPVVFAKKQPEIKVNKRGWSSRSPLTAHGVIIASGDGDYIVELKATWYGPANCVNPGENEHIPYGRTPISAPVTSGPVTVEDKGGSFTLTVKEPTTVPVSPSPKYEGCPNDSWSVQWDPSAFWSEARIYLYEADNYYPGHEIDSAHFVCSIDKPEICTLAE
jgi:hypothetical protein